MPDKIRSAFAPMRPPEPSSNASTDAPTSTVAESAPPKERVEPRLERVNVTAILSIADAIQDEPGVGIIRSQLSVAKERQIHVRLNRAHLLTARALARADTTTTKFFVALLLSEYCVYWRKSDDGRRIYAGILDTAGIPREPRLWWTGLAAALAKSPLFGHLINCPSSDPSARPGRFHSSVSRFCYRHRPRLSAGWAVALKGEQRSRPRSFGQYRNHLPNPSPSRL
jgi:hypothetical protein